MKHIVRCFTKWIITPFLHTWRNTGDNNIWAQSLWLQKCCGSRDTVSKPNLLWPLLIQWSDANTFIASAANQYPYTSFKTDRKLDPAKWHAKTHSTLPPISYFPPSASQVLLTLEECWVVMGAVVNQTGARVRLQARSGQPCSRWVKHSSHYHADTEENNGGSICSCQPLQIWCQPVHWRQQARPFSETTLGAVSATTSNALIQHSG